MADILFVENREKTVGIKTWYNVCVVGLDGKGWISGSLLTAVSPLLRDIMASLPPDSDHCIILPDLGGKEIHQFFIFADSG